MKNGKKALICGAGLIAFAATAPAVPHPTPHVDGDEPPKAPSFTLSPDNPYGAIVERNIFDLHDPPPPHDPKDDKPKEPPANVKLTGILTIFGKKQAMFIVNEPGAAGKPAKTLSLILSEHQREGVLEVLDIDPKARTAKIRNEDVESLIHIETNKVASGGPGPGAPGGPPPGARGGQPGAYQHGGTPLPERPLRTEVQPQQPQAASPVPTYGYGGAAAPQQPALSQDEQNTLIEAQRALSMSGQMDPNIAKILPPTSMMPSLGSQNPGAEQQTAPPAPTASPSPLGSYTTGKFGQ